jgi:hypothetical protein
MASRPAVRATKRNISDQYNIACTLWSLILQEGWKPIATPFRRNYAPFAPSQDNFPTWIAESELISPKTFRSHRTTTMTTTPFKIDLIDPAIGM